MPTLNNLVFYGVRDIVVPDGDREFRLFVYFPSLDGAVWTAPILGGTFPLILFVHGNRTGTEIEGLCPTQTADDYRRWWTALHLLARAGFVVACPDVSSTIDADPTATVQRLERALDYLYNEWENRNSLEVSKRGERRFAVAGHSWGANAGLRLTVNSDAAALATIAGTWENGSDADFRRLDVPFLIISGTGDDLLANSHNQPYLPRNPPKHQVALQATGHWAWFRKGEIYPCNDKPPYGCTSGAHILMEVLGAFFERYMHANPGVVPFLLEDPGNPPNRQDLDYLDGGGCAARIRFDTGESVPAFLMWLAKMFTPNHLDWGQHQWAWKLLGRYVKSDTVTVGSWTEGSPWA